LDDAENHMKTNSAAEILHERRKSARIRKRQFDSIRAMQFARGARKPRWSSAASHRAEEKGARDCQKQQAIRSQRDTLAAKSTIELESEWGRMKDSEATAACVQTSRVRNHRRQNSDSIEQYRREISPVIRTSGHLGNT
jgi:hypothetical protein